VCDATAERLAEEYGGECISLPANLADLEGCQQLADEIASRESRLDILVNNAGVSWGAPIEEFPEVGWDKVFDTNVKGVFFLTQKLLPLLKAAGTHQEPGVRDFFLWTLQGRTASPDPGTGTAPDEGQHHRQRHRARSFPYMDAQHRCRRWRRY
jgi:2-deoxy-D-gluconate 3-dehydrogenase